MKARKVTFIFIGLFFLLLFFIFSFVVKKGVLTQFDFNMTVHLQDHTPTKLNKYLIFFADLASVQGITAMLVIFLIFRRKILSGLMILILFFSAHLVEIFGKVFINHPPPAFMFYRHPDVSSYNFQKYYVQEGNSYPSGHMFRSVFLACLLLYVVWQSKKISMLIKSFLSCCIIGMAILIGMSKIILGDHWTSDVIGGTLFGIGISMFGIILL